MNSSARSRAVLGLAPLLVSAGLHCGGGADARVQPDSPASTQAGGASTGHVDDDAGVVALPDAAAAAEVAPPAAPDTDLAFAPLHFPEGDGSSGPHVAVDDSGNIFVAFSFSGPATIGAAHLQNTGGGYDIGVVKLSPKGEVVWTKVYGGSGNDLVYGLAVDPAGSVFVAGSFDSSRITFDALPAMTKRSIADAFVLRLDASGTASAVVDYGYVTIDASHCGDMVVRAGRVLVACEIPRMGVVPMADGSTSQVSGVVVALLRANDLKATWANSLSGPAGQKAAGVALTRDGAAAVLAMKHFGGPVTDRLGTINVSAVGPGTLVTRLNLTSGRADWVKAWADVSDFAGFPVNVLFLRAVAVTDQMLVFGGELTGTMSLGNGQVATSAGKRDGIVGALDLFDGSTRWLRRYGSDGFASIHAVSTDASNRVYADLESSGGALTIEGQSAGPGPVSAVFEVADSLREVNWVRVAGAPDSVAGAQTSFGSGVLALGAQVGVVHAGTFRGLAALGDGKTVASTSPKLFDVFVTAFRR